MKSRILPSVVPFVLAVSSAVPLVAAEADAPVRRLDASPSRLAKIFAPYHTEQATMSPDGRYLAYSEREGGKLFVAVVEIDHPERMTARVEVATDASSTPALEAGTAEPTPAAIRWPTATRWPGRTAMVDRCA